MCVAAWKEAHHVKCAVDGTADDTCSVPDFTVTDKPLVAEAANAVCTRYRQANPDQCYFGNRARDINAGLTAANYFLPGMTADQCGDKILLESGETCL